MDTRRIVVRRTFFITVLLISSLYAVLLNGRAALFLSIFCIALAGLIFLLTRNGPKDYLMKIGRSRVSDEYDGFSKWAVPEIVAQQARVCPADKDFVGMALVVDDDDFSIYLSDIASTGPVTTAHDMYLYFLRVQIVLSVLSAYQKFYNVIDKLYIALLMLRIRMVMDDYYYWAGLLEHQKYEQALLVQRKIVTQLDRFQTRYYGVQIGF